MSQSAQSQADGSGATVRAGFNTILGALFSTSSGASAPSTTIDHQLWADTTNNLLKRRNAANTGWLVICTLDESFVLSRSSNTILAGSDIGKMVLATGTFAQTFTASATLANGWGIHYRNNGSGVITLTPNGAETIDSATTLALAAGQGVTIFCDGSNLYTSGTACRGANTDITSLSGITSINGNQLGGRRNVLTNGDINVWQRSASGNGSYTLTTSVAYGGPDRWMARMATSAAATMGQNAAAPANFKFCLRVGRNSGSALTNQIIIAQALTSINSIPLAGKTVTFSFYAMAGANYSSGSSDLSVVLYSGTGSDQAGSIFSSWTGSGTPINATAVLTTSWQRFQYSCTLGSTVTQLAATFAYTPVGTAGSDDNYYITGVQLEVGSVATPYEYRPYAEVLAECEFYYEKSFLETTAPAQNAGTTGAYSWNIPTGASGACGGTIPLKRKRTAPTITTFNPSASNANFRDTINSADKTVTVGDTGENNFRIEAASCVAASTIRIHWTADAEL